MHPFQGPTTRASFQRPNACPPQAFLEELARFPDSLIGTSPLPSFRATHLSLVHHPAWKSFTCVLPCRCGGSDGKNSVAAYGASESWAGPRGLFTIPWSLRHCRKGLCHRIAAQDVPAVLAVVLKSGLFSPCLHVATGLLHLFAETFDHFRLSAWFSILVLIAQPLHSCGSDASISGLHLLLNKSSLKKEETFPLRKLFILLLSSSRVLGRNSPPFASTASLTLRALNASPSFRHGVHRGEEAVRR